MKAKVKQSKEQKPFPKIMSLTNGCAVLFNSHGKGTYLALAEGSARLIGDWNDDLDMSRFEDFNGSVTLSND